MTTAGSGKWEAGRGLALLSSLGMCAIACSGVITPVRAQVAWFPSADLRAATRSAPGESGGGAIELAPALALRAGGAGALLRADGALRASGAALRSVDGEGAAALRPVGVGELAAELRASYETAERTRDRRWRADGALLFRRGRAAAGLVAGAGVLAAGDRERTVVAPTGRLGAWLRARGLAASAELLVTRLPLGTSGMAGRDTTLGSAAPSFPFDSTPRRGLDTAVSYVPTSTAGGGTTTEAATGVATVVRQSPALTGELRIGLAVRRGGLDVDGAAGLLLARGRRAGTWGTVTAARWLGPRVAIVAGAGVRPHLIISAADRGPRDRPSAFAVLGVRLAPLRPPAVLAAVHPPPAAAGTRVARAGDQVTVELDAPGASRVELAGDFTRWEAVALRPAGGGRWRVTLPLAPGVYRAHVRVDGGAWEPPPGAARVRDPYEGVVGLIVVE